jgi:hypothetical protein
VRFIVPAVCVATALFGFTDPSLSGSTITAVTPDNVNTSRVPFDVSVSRISNAAREPENWKYGVNGYLFSIKGHFPETDPGHIRATIWTFTGGPLLATADLWPKWQAGYVNFEVTLSEATSEKTELNVVRFYPPHPSADIWKFHLGSFVELANKRLQRPSAAAED